MKKIYFLSDVHLGSLAISDNRQHERRIVAFLDSIKEEAEAIYLLGDIFDFWYEYKTVVPKGFTRFLGKISEFTDRGIEVHFFMGNHDQWCGDYLEKECGMIIHPKHEVIEIRGKKFLLAHGDGLGDPNLSFKILSAILGNRACKIAFSALHPRWGITFGLNWAKQSRMKHANTGEPKYWGEDKEHLVQYAKSYLESHPETHYLLFGHRHLELDLMLSRSSRLLLLGDFIEQCTYAVYDGETIYLDNYLPETK